MRRVRQWGTQAENEVAAVLRDLGFHFRRNVRDLPGTPDFANKTRKWVVFVNGCFWHRHANCVRATTPTRNREFWLAKFSANVARDRANEERLRARGFKVVVVWECETRDKARMRRRLSLLKKWSGVKCRERKGHLVL